MKEKYNFDYKKLYPFKWYIIENFPFLEDSIDALDNYQLFCKLGKEININRDAINKLGFQIEGITDWFDNLDVQDEINNKLDDMAESGELEEIIGAYLNTRAIFGFDNVLEMQNATNLIDGSYARTLGYYIKNDGGAGLYKIRNVTTDDEVDNGLIIPISSTLVAELIIQNHTVSIKQFGAKGDEVNDESSIFQTAINNVPNGTTIYVPVGDYLMNSKISFPHEHIKVIYMNGFDRNQSTLKFNLTSSTESAAIEMLGTSTDLNKCELKNLKIMNIKENDSSQTNGIQLHYNLQTNCLENISVESFYNNIDLGQDNWSFTLKNVRSLYARNYGLKMHGVINNIHLDGCDILDNYVRNISIVNGIDCSIENSDFSIATHGQYGIYGYNCNGININNCYYESSDNNSSAISGIKIESSQGININAIDVSNDNSLSTYKTFHILDTKASIINGLTYKNTNTNRTQYVIYYENSYNSELGVCFFANAKNCIYVANSSVFLQGIHLGANINKTIVTTSNGIVFGYIRNDVYVKSSINSGVRNKTRLIGVDALTYGPTANRPHVFQTGQVYYDTTLYKYIFGTTMPTFDDNGNVTAGDTWSDVNGQSI